MGIFVICAYRPKTGKDLQLRRVLKKHLPVLRKQGFVTKRAACLMRASDGTYVEVFEWKSAATIDRAHKDPAVQTMWAEFDAACTYDSIGNLEESKRPFSDFTPVKL